MLLAAQWSKAWVSVKNPDCNGNTLQKWDQFCRDGSKQSGENRSCWNDNDNCTSELITADILDNFRLQRNQLQTSVDVHRIHLGVASIAASSLGDTRFLHSSTGFSWGSGGSCSGTADFSLEDKWDPTDVGFSVICINKEVGHLKALSIGRFPRMKTFWMASDKQDRLQTEH